MARRTPLDFQLTLDFGAMYLSSSAVKSTEPSGMSWRNSSFGTPASLPCALLVCSSTADLTLVPGLGSPALGAGWDWVGMAGGGSKHPKNLNMIVQGGERKADT